MMSNLVEFHHQFTSHCTHYGPWGKNSRPQKQCLTLLLQIFGSCLIKGYHMRVHMHMHTHMHMHVHTHTCTTHGIRRSGVAPHPPLQLFSLLLLLSASLVRLLLPASLARLLLADRMFECCVKIGGGAGLFLRVLSHKVPPNCVHRVCSHTRIYPG
jgi:hypothetical protein